MSNVSQFAFIFDMDGVIVDSTVTHTEAWKKYLSLHDIELIDIAQRMLGRHNHEIVREFFRDHTLTPELVTGHGAAKEALYRDMMRPVLQEKLVPGVVDFIHRHADVPMAVASNAERANLEFVLDLAGLQPYFRSVIDGHQVERPKPAPDIYLRAAEALGVTPRSCVVFEDSHTGVTAALSAGMKVVGIRTTLEKFDNVDISIEDFRDPDLDSWLQSATGFVHSPAG